MEYTAEIGKSGIMVPRIGMGTWAIGGGKWWGENDDSLSVSAVRRAVDLGIKWFDTAPVYGLGHSEEIVGEALKGKRSEVILSTKCALEWDHETPVIHKTVDGIQVYRDLSRKGIRDCLTESLRRLKTDYVDILYTHWQTSDFSVYPIEETVSALMELKKEGLIRAIGASNVNADIVRSYDKYGQLDVIQEKYSLMTRRVEKDLLPVCQELSVSIQAYSPLEQGLLTGNIGMDTVFPDGNTRNTNPQYSPERRIRAIELLDKWKYLTDKYSCTMSGLVINITLQMLPGLHVLFGARKVFQVEENVRALEIGLSDEDKRMMIEDVKRILG